MQALENSKATVGSWLPPSQTQAPKLEKAPSTTGERQTEHRTRELQFSICSFIYFKHRLTASHAPTWSNARDAIPQQPGIPLKELIVWLCGDTVRADSCLGSPKCWGQMFSRAGWRRLSGPDGLQARVWAGNDPHCEWKSLGRVAVGEVPRRHGQGV